MKYTPKLALWRRNQNYKSTKIFGLKVMTLQHRVAHKVSYMTLQHWVF